MQICPEQHQRSPISVNKYSTAENWCRLGTKCKNKCAGTKMLKCSKLVKI